MCLLHQITVCLSIHLEPHTLVLFSNVKQETRIRWERCLFFQNLQQSQCPVMSSLGMGSWTSAKVEPAHTRWHWISQVYVYSMLSFLLSWKRRGYGDGSVSSALVSQTWGSDFRSSEPIQKVGCSVILHTCDPSTGKVETGGSLELIGWLIVKWNWWATS